MKREITLKFVQTIPKEYIDGRKSLEQAANTLISSIKNEFSFNGEIEVLEAKEIE